MTRDEWNKYAADRIICLDGATGSNLMKAGMPSGVCPEQWILEHRDIMKNLQMEYLRAGSDILYTPTFSGNRIKLREYGLEDQQERTIHELVSITADAMNAYSLELKQRNPDKSTDAVRKILLAGDLTMTGELLEPFGNRKLEDLITVYKEQITYLVSAGVDLLVIETMMSLQETRAALIAAREVCSLPVMVTMTFEGDGKTLYGTDARTAAIVLESLGACAIGANCSAGPLEMSGIIDTIFQAVKIPVIAKPNAGLPKLDREGNTCYDMDELVFAEGMMHLLEKGASILGGCCGTTPAHIKMLKEKADYRRKRLPMIKTGIRNLCSERRTVSFAMDGNFIIVGERINPTGKKKLQADLREGSYDLVRQFAEDQEACGAHILDINVGMSGIDEKSLMLETIQEVSSVTSLPLAIDSSHVEVIEAALRHYPGRALINSISLEKEKFERLLPIAAKYGAMFVLLPLSDNGLPKDLDEKKQIINIILERALELGLTKEDIIVDGLVNTIGANKAAALETLETIRYCKENGLATICGLSNISFGMPERGYVNAAFLTMAIMEGLTMAIANPSQDLLVSCALAADLLLNKEEADIRYIDHAGQLKEKQENQPLIQQHIQQQHLQQQHLQQQHSQQQHIQQQHLQQQHSQPQHLQQQNIPAVNEQDELFLAVLKGNRNGIRQLTQKAVEEGKNPSELLNISLLPAINLTGEYFNAGKYFLPQLIASAEAMKNAIEILEPYLAGENNEKEMATVVIATVEGDIHDIGKNLVALMLKNHGFHVVDLGKDVPKETIINTAREYNAEIIALSALMTTTMQQMKEVIAYARKEKLSSRIMIGGAVITQEYADEIGADGYSKDAAEAVKLARSLIL